MFYNNIKYSLSLIWLMFLFHRESSSESTLMHQDSLLVPILNLVSFRILQSSLVKWFSGLKWQRCRLVACGSTNFAHERSGLDSYVRDCSEQQLQQILAILL